MNFATDTTQGLRTAHVTWHRQLEACEDVDHVLTLTREFLATFGPEHLAHLPEGCRPGRIKGEDDIAYWGCKLAQCHHADPAIRVDADLLQELLNYFLHAWVRLSQIQRVSLPAANAKLH